MSVMEIIEQQAADVLIIKPMIVGGLCVIKKIIDMARNEGLRVNLGSLLESSVARLGCLHLASAHNISEECGLLMGHLYCEDLCYFPEVEDGICKVPEERGIGVDDVTL